MFDHQQSGNRSVLVTGAAGLIGLPVIRSLRRNGLRVIAVDDGSAGTLGRLEEFTSCPDVAIRVADIRHAKELARLIAATRPWGVIHLAARHFIPDCERHPGPTLDINVLGTQHLIDACNAHPPARLVFASTADVYAAALHPHGEDDPVGPVGVYGCSKLLGERLLRDQAHRLPECAITIARLFNVYGPGDMTPHLLPEMIRQLQHGPDLQLGDLESVRDFVYVDDVADALVALLDAGHSGVFNVGTGHAASGRELAGLLADALGEKITMGLDPNRLRPWTRPSLCAAPDRLRQILPWWPRTTLRDGVALTIADGAARNEARAS